MVQLLPVPVREGDLLAGKYRVERVIGSGGMGIVVAARHEQLGQLVAIKLVRDEALDQGDTVERFLREARAAVQLRSEHVAKVLDVGKLESGAPYMVMEFLDGSDLGKILTDSGPMALETAVLMMLQTCEAVAEAHAAGIVHRDLKPQNLFLTRTLSGSPRLKVLDFGVSKSAGLTQDGKGALTRTRAMLGSPLYMAPEQMRSSRDVDCRVDVWALGVVLFELLTRRWPFEAESMPELCLKVVTEPPQSLADFRPDVPPAVGAIIERCLAKDPAGRFSSAGELAAALEPFAPPLMSRMSVDRPRPTMSVPMPAYSVEMGRPTLPSAETPKNLAAIPRQLVSGQQAAGANLPSGATPATWDATQARPPESRRSRTAPVLVALLVGVGVLVAMVLIRRGTTGHLAPSAAELGAVAAAPPPQPTTTPPQSEAPSPAALPAPSPPSPGAQADLSAASVGPSVAPLPEAPDVAASRDSLAKQQAAVAPPSVRPVVRPTGVPPVRAAGSAPLRNGIGDDDIPALR